MYYGIEIASTSGVKMYCDIEIPSTSEVKMYDDIEIPSDLPKTTLLESTEDCITVVIKYSVVKLFGKHKTDILGQF